MNNNGYNILELMDDPRFTKVLGKTVQGLISKHEEAFRESVQKSILADIKKKKSDFRRRRYWKDQLEDLGFITEFSVNTLLMVKEYWAIRGGVSKLPGTLRAVIFELVKIALQEMILIIQQETKAKEALVENREIKVMARNKGVKAKIKTKSNEEREN